MADIKYDGLFRLDGKIAIVTGGKSCITLHTWWPPGTMKGRFRSPKHTRKRADRRQDPVASVSTPPQRFSKPAAQK
jgi:hypothetical protein